MAVRLLEGQVVGDPKALFPVYELTVEHSRFSWGRMRTVKTVRRYRKDPLWLHYPQGVYVEGDLADWLEAQVQQFEWSQEAGGKGWQAVVQLEISSEKDVETLADSLRQMVGDRVRVTVEICPGDR